MPCICPQNSACASGRIDGLNPFQRRGGKSSRRFFLRTAKAGAWTGGSHVKTLRAALGAKAADSQRDCESGASSLKLWITGDGLVAEVFVSYNREDLEIAERIVRGLVEEGVAPWLDQDLRAGENYDEVTEERLRNAKAVVVLWSRRSVKSRWVRAEATIASRKSAMVPAMIEECDRPLMFELIQTADLSKWDGDRKDPQWRAFIDDIRKRIESANQGGVAPGVLAGEAALGARAQNKQIRKAKHEAKSKAASGMGKSSPRRPGMTPGRKGGGFLWALLAVLTLAALGVGGFFGWREFGPRVLAAVSASSAQSATSAPTEAEEAAAAAIAAPPAPAPIPPVEPPAAARDEFQDCEACPKMLRIKGGQFQMGAPEDELSRKAWEGPVRQVSVADFALSATEVTFDAWDACVADRGCNGYVPTDREWGRGKRPVIHVSWQDARAYAQWLSKKTGRTYRLPSEAEWEFAARAGSTTPFWWGALYDAGKAGVGPYPQAVEMLPQNAWGLRGMLGNVAEWVEDCYVNSYASAPQDARPVLTRGCTLRVVRGGAFEDPVDSLRVASRSRNAPTLRERKTGFRVAATP